MANLNDIADALESMGASVDRSTFASKMQNPQFAENVRNALKEGGADVSDSASFYNNYSNTKSKEGQGYKYHNQEEYEDLYANARQVGYSALDPAQKELFNKAFPYSKAAKTMTLQEAQAATDADALQNTAPQLSALLPRTMQSRDANALDVGADVLSIPGRGIASGLDLAWEGLKHAVNAGGNAARAIGGQAAPMPMQEDDYKQEALQQLQNPKGNLLKDPAFLPSLIAGPAVEAIGKIPAIARLVAGVLPAGKAGDILAGMLSGAGQGAAIDAIHQMDQQYSPSEGATAAGIGAVGGAVSPIVSPLVQKLFPYYTQGIINKNTGEINKNAKTALSDMMNQVSFPGTQEQYLNAYNAIKNNIGSEYDQAINAIPESRLAINQPFAGIGNPRFVFKKDVADLGKTAKEDYIKTLQGKVPYDVSPDEIQSALDKKIEQLQKSFAYQKPAYLHGVSAADEQDAIARNKALQEQLQKYYENYHRQGSEEEAKDISDLLKFRKVFSSQYKKSANIDERPKQLADYLLHDAITQKASQIPEYAKYLADRNTNARYSGIRAWGDYLDKEVPNPRGIARSFPMLLNSYVGPTALYKLSRGLSGLGNIVPISKDLRKD